MFLQPKKAFQTEYDVNLVPYPTQNVLLALEELLIPCQGIVKDGEMDKFLAHNLESLIWLQENIEGKKPFFSYSHKISFP